MDTTENIRERLAALADVLLPDVKPYIVFESDELPAGVLVPNAVAYTGLGLDLVLRPWLEERGAWRGRRPCIVICDISAFGAAAPLDWKAHERIACDRHEIAGGLIHEASHVVGDLGLALAEPTPFVEAEACFGFAFSRAALERDTRPRCDLHGPKFLRVAAHLHHRAERAGHHVAYGRVFTGGFDAPPLENAALALEAELPALEHVSPFSICDHPAPPEFHSCWRAHAERWRKRQPDIDSEADEIVTKHFLQLETMNHAPK